MYRSQKLIKESTLSLILRSNSLSRIHSHHPHLSLSLSHTHFGHHHHHSQTHLKFFFFNTSPHYSSFKIYLPREKPSQDGSLILHTMLIDFSKSTTSIPLKTSQILHHLKVLPLTVAPFFLHFQLLGDFPL